MDFLDRLDDAAIASLSKEEVASILHGINKVGASVPLSRIMKLTSSVSPDMVPNMLTQNITAHLEEAFYNWPDTWKLWTRQGTSDRLDKQTIEIVSQLGMIDKLQETGGEYNVKHIPDAKTVQYSIYGYGNIAVVDMETLTNDRLGYFNDLGERLGRAAASRLHYSIYVDNLQANPLFYDGNALFDDTHHNNDLDAAGAGVTPTYDTLVTAFRKLDEIVDDANEPLSADSAYIITGNYWRETFEQLTTNPDKPGTDHNDKNTIRKRVKGVIYSRKLGKDWYLVVDPKEIPGLHIDFFRGEQIPSVVAEKKDSSYQFTHPGRQRWRIGHYYGFVWKYYQAALRGSQNV